MPRAPLVRALTGAINYAAAVPPGYAPCPSIQFESQAQRFGPVPERLPREKRHSPAQDGSAYCLSHSHASAVTPTDSARDPSLSGTKAVPGAFAAEWTLLAPGMAVPSAASPQRPRRKPAPADCEAARNNLGELAQQKERLFAPPPPVGSAERRQRLRDQETRGRTEDIITGARILTVVQQTKGPRRVESGIAAATPPAAQVTPDTAPASVQTMAAGPLAVAAAAAATSV